MTNRRVLPLLLLALALPAAAQPDPSCGLDAAGIKADASLSREQACLVYGDLMFLKGMQFSEQGPQFEKWFGAGKPEEAGQRVFDWVKARTTLLGKRRVVDAYAANLGHAARAKAIAESHPYGSIVLTDEFFALTSRIKRLAVYVHEARHSDGDANLKAGTVDQDHPDTSHGFCRVVSIKPQPQGTLGDNGCDPTFNAAYAYQAIFLNNLAKACVNCSDAEKAEAKSDGQSALLNHHLEAPMPFPAPR
jgi:hypothetical protein